MMAAAPQYGLASSPQMRRSNAATSKSGVGSMMPRVRATDCSTTRRQRSKRRSTNAASVASTSSPSSSASISSRTTASSSTIAAPAASGADRAQAARRARSVVEVGLVDGRRAVHERAPDDDAGGLRRRVAVEGDRAHPRADAVGADEQLVARTRAVAQLDLGAVERLDGRAEPDVRAASPAAPSRMAWRAGAGSPPCRGAGAPPGAAARTRPLRARRVVVAERGHAEPVLDDGVEQPERPQRAKRRRLERDPGRGYRPFGLVVDDVDLDAAARERAGQRQAADAPAHDERPLHRRDPRPRSPRWAARSEVDDAQVRPPLAQRLGDDAPVAAGGIGL